MSTAGPKYLSPVPPVGGTGGAAAGTQDALIQAIQLLPVLHRLIVWLPVLGCTLVLPLEVRLNGGILLVEVGHVWHKVLDHVHVRERVHLDRLAGGGVNLPAHTEQVGQRASTVRCSTCDYSEVQSGGCVCAGCTHQIHARVLFPLMFMAHEPHIPERIGKSIEDTVGLISIPSSVLITREMAFVTV